MSFVVSKQAYLSTPINIYWTTISFYLASSFIARADETTLHHSCNLPLSLSPLTHVVTEKTDLFLYSMVIIFRAIYVPVFLCIYRKDYI